MGLINFISLRQRVAWFSRRHLLKVTQPTRARSGGGRGALPTPSAGPHTCLSSQAWEVPPEVGEASRGPAPAGVYMRWGVGGGGWLPSSCGSVRRTHLSVTHTFPHKPASRLTGTALGLIAQTPTPLLPAPPGRVCTAAPTPMLSRHSGLGRSTRLCPPPPPV